MRYLYVQMAAEAVVRGNVGNSRRILDEAYETGTAILGSMASQRNTLKVKFSPWHQQCRCRLLLPAATH